MRMNLRLMRRNSLRKQPNDRHHHRTRRFWLITPTLQYVLPFIRIRDYAADSTKMSGCVAICSFLLVWCERLGVCVYAQANDHNLSCCPFLLVYSNVQSAL